MTLIATKMHVLFYELGPGWADKFGGTYFRYKTHKRRTATGGPVGPSRIGYSALRIWSWNPETDEVKYIKHRDTGTMTLVDRKEFLMVQLQAQDYKNETV